MKKRSKDSGKTYSTEEIKEAIKESLGIISSAARRLGCDRSTLYKRISQEPEIEKTVNDYEEELVDLAEEGLREKLVKREPWAIQFVLKTKGKRRGYSDQGRYNDRQRFVFYDEETTSRDVYQILKNMEAIK
jgi:hypothetical protein